jgi:hypothetical protein
MKTGTASTMVSGVTRVKSRAGFVGIFVKLLPGNRALVDFKTGRSEEYLSDLEIAAEE